MAKLGKDDKVEVRNPNAPDHVSRVDAEKYNAMRKALIKVLPTGSPGMTSAEMLAAVKSTLTR